jgi:hypothetical protein
MKLRRLLAAFAALLLFVPPNSLHPQERPARKIAPIRRPAGYEALKKQADAERKAAERAAPETSTALPAPAPRAPVTSLSFAGMDFNDTPGFVPPDTHAATGPNHIVETVNTTMTIYDRSNGNLVSGPNDLNTFFSVASNHSLTDPVVFYDEIIQRFFIGVIDFGTNDPPTSSNLLYAVSSDASPTGPTSFTHKYAIPVHHSGITCSGTVEADFTRGGWNADAHVFTFNMFNFATNCFDGVRVVIIDKSTIDSGSLVSHVVEGSNLDITLTPAVMHGSQPGDPMWFVESVFFNQIRVVKMTGSPNILTTPSFDPTDISVANYAIPPSATQPGGTQTIDTGDTRILNVEWRGDRLVATHAVGVSGLARARWYEFDTSSTPMRTQQGSIAPSSLHTYYPSIAIAANGDIGMTFMQSSSNQFMSMYVTGQSVGDPAGTMQTPKLVKQGQGHYIAFDCDPNSNSFISSTCRAGDFSGITADPDASDTFCAANEYATNDVSENWGTWITCFQLMASHDLAVTAIKAPKSVSGGSLGNVFGAVSVTIQNRSDHAENITLANLGDGFNTGLVTLDVQPGSGGADESCNAASVMLDPVKTPALFSKTPTKIVKIGGTLTVPFRVTYNCASPAAKSADLNTADYTHTATVHHDALAGGHLDTHPEDDMCPRVPQGFDANPPPKGTTDKGCGAKTPPGGPVVTNILP